MRGVSSSFSVDPRAGIDPFISPSRHSHYNGRCERGTIINRPGRRLAIAVPWHFAGGRARFLTSHSGTYTSLCFQGRQLRSHPAAGNCR